MNELLTKFREAPGLMTLEEIIQVKNFLVEFINLFEIYIEKANWYFDWVQNNLAQTNSIKINVSIDKG